LNSLNFLLEVVLDISLLKVLAQAALQQ